MKPLIIFNFTMIFLMIFLLGIYFNDTAITENDCKMPVNADYDLNEKNHISYKKIAENGLELKYKAYTDYFKIENIKFKGQTYNYYFSIGDVFLLIGSIGFCYFFALLGWKLYKIK